MTKTEKKQYFAGLRADWASAKKQLTAEKISAIEAIRRTHGLKVSNTGFFFVSLQMKAQGLDGIPYLDAKTYKGWAENGFQVKKGSKSTLSGVTWINVGGNDDDDDGYMLPKGYHLFHRSQVSAA